VKVIFKKQFYKDLSNIPGPFRQKIEKIAFEELPGYSHIAEAGNIEKLKGYNNYFRIRVGDYRIGIYLEDDGIKVERVLHRKEIYKFFP